jgi:hypothetical protein
LKPTTSYYTLGNVVLHVTKLGLGLSFLNSTSKKEQPK